MAGQTPTSMMTKMTMMQLDEHEGNNGTDDDDQGNGNDDANQKTIINPEPLRQQRQ